MSLRLHAVAPAIGEATVTVDGQALGPLDFVVARGVALPPGTHHVTVEAPRFFPWDREVEARPGAPPIVLDVALTRVPD